MGSSTLSVQRVQRRPSDVPYHLVNEAFEGDGAEKIFTPKSAYGEEDSTGHMPDEVTRELSRCMHYAAYRMGRAKDAGTRSKWHRKYLDRRDRIVLGNRKLVYRAVRRWMPSSSLSDDMTSDCHIVLIQAVSAFNPWIGIRFSTYAFTCLMRALSRMSQRQTNDRLSRSLSLESLPDGEPRDESSVEGPGSHLDRIDQYLRQDNDLLSSREKMVIRMRFSLDDQAKSGTLAQVGRQMGLSKERVRQVQTSALDKLRKVLVDGNRNL